METMIDAVEGEKMALEQVELARSSAEALRKATVAKVSFDRLLDEHLEEIRQDNPRMSLEMACQILSSRYLEARQYRTEYYVKEGQVKADHIVINAIQAAMSYKQTVMRYERENTTGG